MGDRMHNLLIANLRENRLRIQRHLWPNDALDFVGPHYLDSAARRSSDKLHCTVV